MVPDAMAVPEASNLLLRVATTISGRVPWVAEIYCASSTTITDTPGDTKVAILSLLYNYELLIVFSQ
jgi:hypothetical protein